MTKDEFLKDSNMGKFPAQIDLVNAHFRNMHAFETLCSGNSTQDLSLIEARDREKQLADESIKILDMGYCLSEEIASFYRICEGLAGKVDFKPYIIAQEEVGPPHLVLKTPEQLKEDSCRLAARFITDKNTPLGFYISKDKIDSVYGIFTGVAKNFPKYQALQPVDKETHTLR